ncbi:YqkE family protein [Paenibacillus beijingensis]|uniref:Uncharacterized protein n=1 Tax=Paenibacillus beijingensis TaxID=1126833 RepID=A0A0D5NLR3_9BACL|nr:YqkE family protein [Paenibacillus beijingensis]AJY75942.1 hypothetical protein VN24_17025 [Paenibacillus beijingensis]
MAKKKGRQQAPQPAEQHKPATLKDLLSSETLDKLKNQAASMKAEEEKRKEEARRKAEEARAAEQKRRENDFAYLLENSGMDWKKYK